MTQIKTFKVSIENELGDVYYFFTSNINQLLSSSFFNRKVMDAKTGDSFVIKEELIKKLNIGQPNQ